MDDDRRDLTSGDPLGGGPAAPTPPPAPTPPAAAAPERPTGQYAPGSAPPGAFAPQGPGWQRPDLSQGNLADWWKRAVATIVDGVIVGGVTLVILAILGVGIFADGNAGTVELILAAILSTLLFAAIALLYAPLIMARTNGQTLGKMVVGIRVVRTSGKPIDFWWAALREVAVKGLLVGIASSITGGIAYLVDVIWPLPDRQNRALHDFVVDSRVVNA